MHGVKQKHLKACQALATKENYSYNLCLCPSSSLSPTLGKEGVVAGVGVGGGKKQDRAETSHPVLVPNPQVWPEREA